MAIFTDKIQSAHFINADNTVIEVLYKENADDEALIPYIVEVDYKNEDFIDLINEFNLEAIEKETQLIREQELAAFRVIVEDIISENPKIEKDLVLDSGNFLNYLDKNSNNADVIFDIKVNILEDISDINDKTLKTKIRKSKNLYELLAIYCGVKFKG